MGKVVRSSNPDVTRFVKLINTMAPERSRFEVFTDWTRCAAIAFSNVGRYSQKFEDEYLTTIAKYSKVDQLKFPMLLEILTDGLEKEYCDFLGEVYMSCDMGNVNAGQFFTPYNVSLASAQMTIRGDLDNTRIYSFGEPSCGSGGMIIAVAEVLRDKGFPFQRNMIAVMGDIDITAVHMAVIQCSVIGIPAVISHQNSLTLETWRVYETPAVGMSLVLERWRAQEKSSVA